MTVSAGASLLMIGMVAGITFLTRAAPFMLFSGKREMPAIIRFLGTALPPAIIATLVVYCVRAVALTVFPYGLAQWISIAVVVALHLWKRNTLLSIAGGTICYMVLIRTVFPL